MRSDIPFADPARVGVAMHVFFPELVDELIEQLGNIPVPFDLIITNSSGTELADSFAARLPNLRNSVVLDIENRGRDILPLLAVVNARLLDPYDLVLKVHTKKSAWRQTHDLGGDGESWRTELLGALLGSPDNVKAILTAFQENRGLGTITAPGSVLGSEYWGDNQRQTRAIARRIELSVPEEITFAAGSMYWTQAFVLQGLRSLRLQSQDFPDEAGQVNQTTAHAVERLLGVLAAEAGMSIIDTSEIELGRRPLWQNYCGERSAPRVTLVPFYLPQFHPIPENDRWWGKGFTEWSNVSRALPVYSGHQQPKIPLDTGFYDLRNPATASLQIELATEAGIAGFMYYFYWFAGKRILDLPIESRLAGDDPFPFCIMWANENWTRSWNGRDQDVLMEQRYDEVPAEQFIEDVMPLLRDPRYLRVGGRPLVAVYRPGQLPDLDETVAKWRAVAKENGLDDLFLLAVDVASSFDGIQGDAFDHGFDGTLGFPPHNLPYRGLEPGTVTVVKGFKGSVLSYADLAIDAENADLAGVRRKHFPGVATGFDNTPRRQLSSHVWHGSNPYTFRRWLSSAVKSVVARPRSERLVFINAWNEWAEGAVLEPSEQSGSSYLLAVRNVAF